MLRSVIVLRVTDRIETNLYIGPHNEIVPLSELIAFSEWKPNRFQGHLVLIDRPHIRLIPSNRHLAPCLGGLVPQQREVGFKQTGGFRHSIALAFLFLRPVVFHVIPQQVFTVRRQTRFFPSSGIRDAPHEPHYRLLQYRHLLPPEPPPPVLRS